MHTDFSFKGQKSVYRGKVREVYTLENGLLVMVATDRLSAFDVVMPKGIPFKGQILNQIATRMLQDTSSKVPNWLIATPDPNVAIGKACEPFKVEMVIRGYLAGHSAECPAKYPRITISTLKGSQAFPMATLGSGVAINQFGTLEEVS